MRGATTATLHSGKHAFQKKPAQLVEASQRNLLHRSAICCNEARRVASQRSHW
jgi:hypothetical protein